MRTIALLGPAALWTACSTASPARPPALGVCVGHPDAACAIPVVATGTASDAGSTPAADAASAFGVEGGSCGVAGALLNAASVNCVPCISSACCLAEQACSSAPSCLFLVECARACLQGDTICFGDCQNQQPNGIVAYNDFAQCLLANCTPGCPTLPR